MKTEGKDLLRGSPSSRPVELVGKNPMIQAAMDAGEDATGLCTMREFAEQMLKHPLPEGCNHWIGFKLGEKHYTMFCLLKENP